jgi:Na+-transporting NADH:ubiquinone oxidoreductase subunit C
VNKNGLIYTVVFTFLTAFFFVFFLALANGATVDIVRENQQLAVQRAVLSALGILPDDEASIPSVYDDQFDSIPSSGDRLQTELNGKSVLIKYFSGSGLWGTITGILAVDESIDTIVGLEIISHNETPGLGGRIDESWFKDQFKNERILNNAITVRKGNGNEDTDSSNSTVDGITGASLTSKSIETIVNAQLTEFQEGGK